MLVVANGAYKSGSTWIFKMAEQLLTYEPLPKAYSIPEWHNPSVPEQKMESFLQEVDYIGKNYIFKSHFPPDAGMREVLGNRENIVILNVYRDVKDVIVSKYYHDMRVHGSQDSFDVFFNTHAEALIGYICRYHLYWNGTDKPANLLLINYCTLRRRFERELLRMARFLGCPNIPSNLRGRIQARTEIKRQQNKDSSTLRHMRKGIVGDWKNHMTIEQADFVNRCVADFGIDPVSGQFSLMPNLR